MATAPVWELKAVGAAQLMMATGRKIEMDFGERYLFRIDFITGV